MREEGVRAFRQYQWLHGPGNKGQAKAASPLHDRYFYHFRLHGFPFFVCDARTGRQGRRFMLHERQFERLIAWLKSMSPSDTRPKFIVSSSVVVPFLADVHRGLRSDGWDGFGTQLRELLALIAVREIQNVVFLCGDSHLSNCSVMEFSHAGRIVANAYCVVASPMYGPYPFANATRADFLENNCAAAGDDEWRKPFALRENRTMRYRTDAWVTGDSVTIIAVTPDWLEVRIGNAVPNRFPLRTRAPACLLPPAPAAVPGAVATEQN